MDSGKYKAWGRSSLGSQHWTEVLGPLGQYRPAESRLKAMAVPMTSCMSEPTMASSMVSQTRVRGTWGGGNLHQGWASCLAQTYTYLPYSALYCWAGSLQTILARQPCQLVAN